MRIMSIDYGDKRTGVALCDEREMLASPYGVIEESYMPKLVKALCEIAKKEGAKKLVIGLPRNMDGSYGYRCDECRALGDELEKSSSLPVEYQDERLTTVISHNVLSANNVSAKKRKESVDALSAVMILQSYIDSHKS